MYLYFTQIKKCRSNALCIYTFYASKYRKKSNLLPIQAREGLGVISGCIFCLQVCEPIAGELISGGGVGELLTVEVYGIRTTEKQTRTFSTNTHFFNKHILY